MKKLVLLLMTLALFTLTVTPAVYAASGELREGIDYVRVSPAQSQSLPGISDISFHEILCDTRPEILRDRDCAAGVECHEGDRLLYSQMHDAVLHSTISKLYGGVSGLEHPQFEA